MRHVDVRVFATPDGGHCEKVRIMAPPNEKFTDAGAFEAVSVFIGGNLAELFPDLVFRCVRVGSHKFNIFPVSRLDA